MRLGEFLFAFAQMQRHGGAALRLVDLFERVFAAAVRDPAHAGGLAAAAGVDHDLIGHDEGRIETDAKLADQLRVLLLVAGQAVEKGTRAGLGDRADALHDLVARHAHAVVADGDRAVVLVLLDPDLQLGIAFEQRIVLEALEAQRVQRIRRVGDQFAGEYLLVRIHRMDHQLQQLFHLGLKTVFLGVRARLRAFGVRVRLLFTHRLARPICGC